MDTRARRDASYRRVRRTMTPLSTSTLVSEKVLTEMPASSFRRTFSAPNTGKAAVPPQMWDPIVIPGPVIRASYPLRLSRGTKPGHQPVAPLSVFGHWWTSTSTGSLHARELQRPAPPRMSASLRFFLPCSRPCARISRHSRSPLLNTRSPPANITHGARRPQRTCSPTRRIDRHRSTHRRHHGPAPPPRNRNPPRRDPPGREGHPESPPQAPSPSRRPNSTRCPTPSLLFPRPSR